MKNTTANHSLLQASLPHWFDVGGNRLRLVRAVPVRRAALVKMLEGADKSLKLFFYMFEDDEMGRTTLDMLIAACKRGLAVEMMVDSFGSKGTSRKFFDPLIEAGGKFEFFSPGLSTSYFVRNHQKSRPDRRIQHHRRIFQ
jgi:cardiolipin synthase